MFFKAFEAAKGDVGRLEHSWDKIRITMHAKSGEPKRSEVAAKIVLEGKGRANEGWTMHRGVFSQICADCDPVFFEALLKDY